MTKSRFASALLLVVVCSLGTVPATATVITELTGDFAYAFSSQSNALSGDFFGFGSFYLNPTITSYHQQTVGDFTYYWGTFSGGSGQVIWTSPAITLNAVSIGGSFSGYYNCCDQTETDYFFFQGTWSNGWYSRFNGSGSSDFLYGGFGSIAIYTQTVPEPGSIALLGSGVLGLIAYGRKRLPGSFVL